MLFCSAFVYGCSSLGNYNTEGRSEFKRVERLNHLVNEQVLYTSDKEHFGEDLWALPEDTLLSKKGDCDDISILKYWALFRRGIPHERLGLVIGSIPSGGGRLGHMVVLYIDQIGRHLVLDGGNNVLEPLSSKNNFEAIAVIKASGQWEVKDGVVTGQRVRVHGLPDSSLAALGNIFSLASSDISDQAFLLGMPIKG